MFRHIESAQQDSILALAATFKEDPRVEKIDLGIGVYRDQSGITPIMDAVKIAQVELAKHQQSKVYLSLAGRESFNIAIRDLVLPTSAHASSSALQTPGGSGGLRLMADFIHLVQPRAKVWLSNPGYVNHAPIMATAGNQVDFYPYLDPQTKQVNPQLLLDSLKKLGPLDIVLLQAACHNPTGADLGCELWHEIAQLAQSRGFIPLIDSAYQGLGAGLEQDVLGIKILADSLEQLLVVTSCSKNFGLYCERTGAAIVKAPNLKIANNCKSQLMHIARGTYTMPPDHGASIVAKILHNEKLKNMWQVQLEEMRLRIIKLRHELATALQVRFMDNRFDFICNHYGMFSYTGLDFEQVNRLRNEYAIYILSDGRINLAGLASDQVEYLATAIYQVCTNE